MVCRVKAKSEVKALIEVQAFVSPFQKFSLPENRRPANRTENRPQ